MKILIVDDHSVVREGLKALLQDTLPAVEIGEAHNAHIATELVRANSWDLVLLDISLPDSNGIELLKNIKRLNADLPVLMLSIYSEDQYAVRAIRAGASGYLNKEAATEELVRAVEKILEGGRYISESVADTLANNLKGDNDRPLHERLSDREYLVLCQIASGKSVSDIAGDLSLSVKTISTYRSRLLDKLDMKHNAELTHYAIKTGLVE